MSDSENPSRLIFFKGASAKRRKAFVTVKDASLLATSSVSQAASDLNRFTPLEPREGAAQGGNDADDEHEVPATSGRQSFQPAGDI